MNKAGQMIMVHLLVLMMTVAITIALVPMLNSVLGIGKQSDNLNCDGYIYNGDTSNKLSYNSSLETDTISCIAIGLYIPYLLLAVLIGGVTRLLAGRMIGGGEQQQQYY